jgi:hypothetical protein
MSINESYRSLANPSCIMTQPQREMLENYKNKIAKQRESKDARRKILNSKKKSTSINSHITNSNQLVVDSLKIETEIPLKIETEIPLKIETEIPLKIETPLKNTTPKKKDNVSTLSSPKSFISDNISDISSMNDEEYNDDILPTMEKIETNTDIKRKQQSDVQTDPLYISELSDRLSRMNMNSKSNSNMNYGNHDKTPSVINNDAHVREMEYWRKKVSLEEEAAMKQAGMFLTLLSNLMESLTSAVGFKHIKIDGLSTHVETALETGAFDLAIKNYCSNPSTLYLLQSPTSSFVTSFAHIVLRTHLGNVQRERKEARDKYTKKSNQSTETKHNKSDLFRFNEFMDSYMQQSKYNDNNTSQHQYQQPPPQQYQQPPQQYQQPPQQYQQPPQQYQQPPQQYQQPPQQYQQPSQQYQPPPQSKNTSERKLFRPPSSSTLQSSNILKSVNENMKSLKPIIGGITKVMSANDTSIKDTLEKIDNEHIPIISF